MNSDDFFERMKTKCPILYKDLSYIECAEGWFFLIEKMSHVIERELERLDPLIAEHMYVVQIKEKFGGIRFYMNQSTPHIDGVIDLADMLSFSMCEHCGKIESTRRNIGGYLVTLCDIHYDDELAERKKKHLV